MVKNLRSIKISLSEIKKFGIKDWLKFLLLVFSSIQIITGCINLIFPSEMCNRFLFVFNYVILFTILLVLIADNFLKNCLLFIFYCTFFLFLMGQKLFMPDYTMFLTFTGTKLTTEQYSVFVMIIATAIISLYYSYIFFQKRKETKRTENKILDSAEMNKNKLEKFLFICFLVTLPFAFYMELKVAIVRGSYDYTDGYLINVQIPIIVKIFSYLFPVYSLLTLASHPPKPIMLIVLISLFVVEGGVQLIQGRRALFAISFLFILWYLIKYFDVKKINIKYILIILASGIAIIVLFWIVEIIRSGNTITEASPFRILKDFMISTGGSDSVIANTVVRKNELPDNKFLYLLDPIINNPLTIILSGKSGIVQGEEYIQSFHSLAHWISYMTNSELYCSGYGMGSSYLIGPYVAMGIPGVIIFSVILGKMISVFENLSFDKNLFFVAFCLLLIRHLFTFPRSEYFGWFGDFTYFVFGSIIIYPIYRKILKKKNEN